MSETNKKVFDMRNRPPRPKQKPRKWQHQDELEASIGKVITLYRSAAAGGGRVPGHAEPTVIEGVLVAADQFTIKVRFRAGNEVTHFKHALNSYVVQNG